MITPIREGLTFDDVLLIPQFSELPSRQNVSLDLKLAGGLGFCHPVIPANMKSIMTPEMARAQALSGGLALLHRFSPYPQEYYNASVKDLPFKWRVGVSLGVHKEDRELFNFYHQAGVLVYCIDVAHGDSTLAVEMVKWMRLKTRKSTIIAGNVATGLAASRLWNAGADVVKVGVGPGSLCTTRIETGCGVPQLTALMDVHAAREMRPDRDKKGIIADGGIKNAGDCVKALCFSDFVMCGRLFAGCSETRSGTYEGSSTHKTNHVEGVRALVKPQGPYEAVLNRILEGVRSGCSYQGCALVQQLQEEPEFVRITAAGLTESYPHDVQIIFPEK
jgi:IMP dehydrogenase